MLAVAYGANVGGIGTKIGTIPSTQLSGFLAQRGVEVSFLEFAAIGVPFVLLFLPIVWLALWRVGRADAPAREVGRRALAGEGARLGAMRRGEKVVLAVFLATAAVWVMGKPLTDALRAQRAAGPRHRARRGRRRDARELRVVHLARRIGGACSSPPRCASCSGRRWFCSAAASRSRRASRRAGSRTGSARSSRRCARRRRSRRRWPRAS